MLCLVVGVWREGKDPLIPCSSKPALQSSSNPAHSVKGRNQLVVGGVWCWGSQLPLASVTAGRQAGKRDRGARAERGGGVWGRCRCS